MQARSILKLHAHDLPSLAAAGVAHPALGNAVLTVDRHWHGPCAIHVATSAGKDSGVPRVPGEECLGGVPINLESFTQAVDLCLQLPGQWRQFLMNRLVVASLRSSRLAGVLLHDTLNERIDGFIDHVQDTTLDCWQLAPKADQSGFIPC